MVFHFLEHGGTPVGVELALGLSGQDADGAGGACAAADGQSGLHLHSADQVDGSLLNVNRTGVGVGGGVEGDDGNALAHSLRQDGLQRVKVGGDHGNAVHALSNQLGDDLDFLLNSGLLGAAVHTAHAGLFAELTEANVHIDEDGVGQSLGNHDVGGGVRTGVIVRSGRIVCGSGSVAAGVAAVSGRGFGFRGAATAGHQAQNHAHSE